MTAEAVPATMRAVVLTGHGDLDKLEYHDDWPVPRPATGEVLIRIGACGLNNTDVNTRTAWYSQSVSGATSGGGGSAAEAAPKDASWGRSTLEFPRIQGADVVGEIVDLGEAVAEERLGERVIVDPWLRDPKSPDDRALAGYLGSERDGGFAEYVAVPAVNAFPIASELSDAELATFPCAYSTAEYMISKARLIAGERLLITGASGGVGSALVQLAKRRRATVIAIAGRAKLEAVAAAGADVTVAREEPDLESAVREAAPNGEVDVVADVVGGDWFDTLLQLLVRGGRYVVSGAISGAVVGLDLRTLYLKDLELLGATVMPRGVFQNLVGHIEGGDLKPLLAETFPLEKLRDAQRAFLAKRHVGNIVVVPD